MLDKIFQAAKFLHDCFADFFFPPKCCLCHEYLSDDDGNPFFCPNCLQKILLVKKLTLTSEQRNVIDDGFFLGKYANGLRPLILSGKYNQNEASFAQLQCFLKIAFPLFLKKFPEKNFVAVPVPLSQKKFNERGFNQVELIFRDVFEKNFSIAWLDALIRTRDTEKQSHLTQKERQKNVENAFEMNKNFSVREKKILLVDDIFTTGSTCFECAKILKANGAKKIFVLTLASNQQ